MTTVVETPALTRLQEAMRLVSEAVRDESGQKMVLMGMARYLELRKAEIQMQRYRDALAKELGA